MAPEPLRQPQNPELGITCDEDDWDGDYYRPAQIAVAAPLSVGWFAAILAYAGLSKLKLLLLRSGIGRNWHR